MVGNALKVPDGLQKLGGLLALVHAHFAGAELNEIGAEDVLIVIAALLVVADASGERVGVFGEGAQSVVQRTHGALRHFTGDGAAAAERQRGRGEQTLVQLGNGFRTLAVGNEADGELFEQIARGQQHGCAEKIEHRVRHGDAGARGALIEQRGSKDGTHDAEHAQQHGDADEIEQQVDDRRAAGVLIRADGGEHGGDGGADVLSHDDGDGGGIADRAGGGERLQDADGGGAGLDDASEHRADQHAEDRIPEGKEQIRERGDLREAGDRAAHRLHAEHERGKAEENGAGVLFLCVLAEHIEDDADERENGREGAGLEQPQPDARALDAAEAQKPRGDGGADVRAHDDVDGLPQRHQPRVDKADDHDGGGGRALNDGRYAETGQKADERLAGHLVEQRAQPAARAALQRRAHQAHAEQKQRQAAEHRQKIKNIHIPSLFCFLDLTHS